MEKEAVVGGKSANVTDTDLNDRQSEIVKNAESGKLKKVKREKVGKLKRERKKPYDYSISHEEVIKAIEEYEQISAHEAKFMGMIVKAQRSLEHLSEKQLRYLFKEKISPKDKRGETIILHHHQQKAEGPIIEMPQPNHSLSNKKQHPLGNKGGVGSGKVRADFDTWRSKYWRARYANELLRRGVL